MQKTYVLDTNVLVQAPYALESFEDNTVVLPLAVLEELDVLKSAEGERGANARQAIRYLELLRAHGRLTDGVRTPGGGILRLEVNHVNVRLPEGMRGDSGDARILKVCKGLLEDGEKPVILVSKDIVARIKAQLMDIPAEDFTTDQAPSAAQQYTGRAAFFLADESIERFKQTGLAPDEVYQTDAAGRRVPAELTENEFLILASDQSPKNTLLGRYAAGKVHPLRFLDARPFGVRARSVGQYFLQEALMLGAEEAPLVIVKGPAGTAKTFYALAAGLEKVLEQDRAEYRKILVCRPNAQFDDDIGFLPGTEQDKISPLLRPIVDNLETLLDRDKKDSRITEQEFQGQIEYLFSTGVIAAEAMNFMRGRSIAHTYLVIDEAQNLTPKQVKGIITRVGMGTKVILLGDPEQIDYPLLDERTNGLSFAAERMKNSPLCVQITMRADECERSALALDAARRM